MAALATISMADTVFIDGTGFKNCVAGKSGLAVYTVVNGTGVNMALPDRNAIMTLQFPNFMGFMNANFLRFTLKNNGLAPVDVTFSLESASGASEASWGVLASIPSDRTVTFLIPLISAASFKQTMLPSPNNSMYQLYPRGSLNIYGIRRLRILNSEFGVPVDLTVNDLRTVNLPLARSQYVDALGQQNQITWTGKLNPSDPNALVNNGPFVGVYPFGADEFGGIAGTGSFPQNRFGVVRDSGGRWSFLDPAGNRFFSTGVVGVGATTWATVGWKESAYVSLPSQTGAFAQHWSTIPGQWGIPTKVLNIYGVNLQKKYGTAWKQVGYDIFINRMKNWGFNTLGGMFEPELAQRQAIPSMPLVGVSGVFAKLPSIRGGAVMPDVFDPAWPPAVAASINNRLTVFPENAYQAGLFVDNELPWGDGHSSDPKYRYMVPIAVLSGSSSLKAKIRFVNDLTAKYGTISALNSAWGTSYASFSSVLSSPPSLPNPMRAAQASDFQDFALEFARKYFSTIKGALQARSYGGLYLGCRFDIYTPEAVTACMEYADVLSFNCYDKSPDFHDSDLKTLDFPVLISEFGFGASDIGRVGWGMYQKMSESDRIAAYQNYVSVARQWPNLVGFHYYKWEDNPPAGEFTANVNTVSGLLSITDIPYAGLVQTATDLNVQIMQSYPPLP